MKKHHQGRYKVKNKLKYKGRTDDVIYRSGWEKRFFLFLDNCKLIKEWGSEEIQIPYRSIDGKIHRYFPDIYIKTINDKKYLFEIKPKKQCKPPSKKTKRYLTESLTFVKNSLKWESAVAHCNKNNMNFLILTEEQVNPIFSDKRILDELQKIIEF